MSGSNNQFACSFICAPAFCTHRIARSEYCSLTLYNKSVLT
ncbi:hypothetical protein HMPREF3190_01413 [Umbribacter vaginalis]|nr:hypothetical protein HMPREF3190_01413 [Coriobacteriales bacterium DNF00809]